MFLSLILLISAPFFFFFFFFVARMEVGGRDADLVGDTVSFSILSKCLASVSGEYLSFPPDTNLQENVARQQPHCFRPEAGHTAAMLCIFTRSFLNPGRKNETKVRNPLSFSHKFLASVLESVTDLFAVQSGTVSVRLPYIKHAYVF